MKVFLNQRSEGGLSSWFYYEAYLSLQKKRFLRKLAMTMKVKETKKMDKNTLSNEIIGAAIEVHRVFGPGLLESAYQMCLARELTLRDLKFEKEKQIRLSIRE